MKPQNRRESKIDRRALPAPDSSRPDLVKTFVAPQNELELKLTKIWEKLLDIQPISVKDNFFDIGGHSLLAVRLFAEMNKAFGKNLSVASLFQAPTIQQLASLLPQEVSAACWRCLVPIQPIGSKPPLFFIHACKGDISIYRLLASHLGLDRPIYGLQAQGLDGKQLPHNRIEEMATHYIQEIQTVQPEGPYFLGGIYIGALVAFEMAKQLVSQGQKVGMVVFLGGFRFNPQSPRLPRRFSREWTSRQFEHLLLLGPSYILKRVKEISDAGMMVTKSHLLGIIHKFFPLSIDTLYPLIQQKVSLSMNEAMANYVPQIYPGRVVILQPSGSDNTKFKKLDHEHLIAGSKRFTEDFEIHYVPGTNIKTYTAYKEPYVRIVAEKLRVCIDSCRVSR